MRERFDDSRALAEARLRARLRRLRSASRPRPDRRSRHDYAAIGAVVILASRLSSKALDGQILLSQQAYAAVEGQLQVEDAGELELKGFRRPMPAYLATR